MPASAIYSTDTNHSQLGSQTLSILYSIQHHTQCFNNATVSVSQGRWNREATGPPVLQLLGLCGAK